MKEKTKIMSLIKTEEDQKLFIMFQEIWMKKIEVNQITFENYFLYLSVFLILEKFDGDKRRYDELHIKVMKMVKNLCIDINSKKYIFIKNIELIDSILN